MHTYSQKLNSHDIARRAGVSQATVSRVLSGSPSVRQETRERVLDVVRQLNYQPNAFARAMKTQLSDTVGVVVSRITNPIVPEILLHLANKLNAAGRRMTVWNTDTDGEQGVVSAIRQRSIDGLIFTAANQQSEALDTALGAGLPAACINRHVNREGINQFAGMDFEGAGTITDYLVCAGRKRIAMINGPLDRSTLADREKGVRSALSRHGLSLPGHYFASSDFDHDRFRDLAIAMMKQPVAPDAIICGNDVIAFGVLCGLRSIGCRVPDDVWVTGFDGIEMSGWDVFDLTTMQQPLDDMAAATVDALVQNIMGTGEAGILKRFEPELVIRGTTARTPQQGTENS